MFFFLGQTLFEIFSIKLRFLKKCCVVALLYMIIYESASYVVLHLGKCMICWHGKMNIFYLIFVKEIMDFMVYWKT